jgi:hypothetical protein
MIQGIVSTANLLGALDVKPPVAESQDALRNWSQVALRVVISPFLACSSDLCPVDLALKF